MRDCSAKLSIMNVRLKKCHLILQTSQILDKHHNLYEKKRLHLIAWSDNHICVINVDDLILLLWNSTTQICLCELWTALPEDYNAVTGTTILL